MLLYALKSLSASEISGMWRTVCQPLFKGRPGGWKLLRLLALTNWYKKAPISRWILQSNKPQFHYLHILSNLLLSTNLIPRCSPAPLLPSSSFSPPSLLPVPSPKATVSPPTTSAPTREISLPWSISATRALYSAATRPNP